MLKDVLAYAPLVAMVAWGCGNAGSQSGRAPDAALGGTADSGLGGVEQGAGGRSATGGQSGGSGATSSGGKTSAVATGGAIPADAGSSAGGQPSAGGRLGSGGQAALGGASARGGTSGKGGSPATGGVPSSNGSGGSAGSAPDGGAAAGSPGNTATIHNDTFWKDTSGSPIYSQGGGILLVGDTYYWYGVKYNGAVTYAAKPTSMNDDTSFAGVTIYSSKDLATWKLENTVVFDNAGSWFGRLGVVYNANTKKYVMVAQGAGGLFFAQSDTPTGKFVFDNVQTTLSGIANGATGDQTTFQDDDGKAYLICSSAQGRSNLYVVPLRDADFLAIGNPTRIFSGAGREGNAMFKYDQHYYFCSSDLHGWNASHTYCISASNILGPYGTELVINNTDADFSHVTQNGFYVTVKGSAGSFVVFAGDRWADFAGNGLGYNQWIPLTFDGTTPLFHSLSEWSIDAAAGTWAVGTNNNYALNPSFEADRVSVTTPAGWTTSNGSNVSGGHTGRWSWQLTQSSTLEQQVADLPDGTYTLSVWVKGSGATGASLYAKGCGGTDLSTSLAGANATWTNLSLSGITVSKGTCQIGVSTSAGTLTVDDVVLVRR